MKTGFVALIGVPNAGKSTLLNALIGEKVSIVTDKPQTTRRRVTGILNAEGLQAVLVDAPGVLFSSSSRLNEFLMDEYSDVLASSDVALGILPAAGKGADQRNRILEVLKASGKPFAVVITKQDEAKEADIAFYSNEALAKGARAVLPVSALKDPKGTERSVTKMLSELLPEGDMPHFDTELFTTETVRHLSSEIIREKCFELLSQELPYGLAVNIRSFKEEGGIPRIYADIVLERLSHKGMVIGKKGAMLKEIGTRARLDIEKLMDSKIFLELRVSVKENWMKNQSLMRELGYVLQQ